MSQSMASSTKLPLISPGKFSTSKGMTLFERGPHNPVPTHNFFSGDIKSIAYQGPGYYVPSELRWITYHDYSSLPTETRRDAILFESEDEWVAFQRKRDQQTRPGGIKMSGYPVTTGSPVLQLLPFRESGWLRPWTGAGFYIAPRDKWIRDHSICGIPNESYLFYNEEDWIKFKYQAENPQMTTSH